MTNPKKESKQRETRAFWGPSWGSDYYGPFETHIRNETNDNSAVNTNHFSVSEQPVRLRPFWVIALPRIKKTIAHVVRTHASGQLLPCFVWRVPQSASFFFLRSLPHQTPRNKSDLKRVPVLPFSFIARSGFQNSFSRKFLKAGTDSPPSLGTVPSLRPLNRSRSPALGPFPLFGLGDRSRSPVLGKFPLSGLGTVPAHRSWDRSRSPVLGPFRVNLPIGAC